VSDKNRIVVWDFDGTLVDSHRKNLRVNHAIVRVLTGRDGSEYPALASIEAYETAIARATNWREFYAREFDLRDEQVDRAGELWPRLQAEDTTPLMPFAGVAEALDALAHLPHAIVSQNDSGVIRPALEAAGLADRFRLVLGHGEVGPAGQKPAPDGLLLCLELLDGAGPSTLYYVGDHEIDALCVRNAREALAVAGGDAEVVSIAAHYGTSAVHGWRCAPDHAATSPADVVRVVLGTRPDERSQAPGPPGSSDRERRRALAQPDSR
jgi:HAD superfamily hydrolase (TIGR01549 family)